MTPLTDELLRRRLEARVADAPSIMLGAIARSVAAQPRRRSTPFGWRSAVAGPVAAALIVGVALVGGLLNRAAPPVGPSGPSGPVGSSGSVGSSAAAPSRSPGATDRAPAWTSLAWERTSPEAFASDETIVADAIAVGDGFVAVGTTMNGGKVSGRVWQSDDGRSWERMDDPGIEAMLPRRVVTFGATLVVLGLEPAAGDGLKHLELWQSTDGRTWAQGPTLPVPADPTPVAAGPAGILLPVGQETWLLGPDFTVWTKVTTWPAGVYLGTPAWARGLWILPGTTGVEANGDPSRAAVWTSPDGATWTPGTVEQASGGMFRVLAAEGGLIGIGTGDDVCTRCFGDLMTSKIVWASSDDHSWHRIQPGATIGRGAGVDFVGDGRRVLEIGPTGGVGGSDAAAIPLMSETLDGQTWTAIAPAGPVAPTTDVAGRFVLGSRGVAMVPGNVADPASGAVHPQPWWGLGLGEGSEGPSPTPSPSAQPVLSAFISGCDTLGFAARRCAAVVARAERLAGNPPDIVSIAVQKAVPDTDSAGGGPIANVILTSRGGTQHPVEIDCLFLSGSSDRVCSDDPQISLSNGVSHDTPCGATPGDDNHPCATLPPTPKPAVVAASSPLVLRVFDVPIDHVGHYEILVGEATLPDGLLSERSGELGDPRPTGYWIDNGVGIVVRPGKPCIGERCPSIDNIYHDPFGGPQPVYVYLVFDVVELTTPGTILEVRNLVVR